MTKLQEINKNFLVNRKKYSTDHIYYNSKKVNKSINRYLQSLLKKSK